MPRASKNKKVSVRIKMYRQGLGDCFLLTFKRKGKPDFNMMIDCGLLQGTEKAGEIMNEVVSNIRKTTAKDARGKGKLDVVAVTHEHWDHISGFSQAKKVFDDIDFEEVWVGWTEDESHPQSKALRERFHKQIMGLVAALEQMNSISFDSEQEKDRYKNKLERVKFLVEDFFDADVVLGAKEKSMRRSETWNYIIGKGRNRRYCSPGKILTLPNLEEVRFYILGPPENLEIFTKTEPSAKDAPKETYRGDSEKFALADSFFAAVESQSDVPDAHLPFEKDSKVMHDAGKEEVKKRFKSYFAAEDKWRAIDNDWLGATEQFALHLDSYTNNSCLAIAIELVESGKVLLFPGDAQFGNWISWKDLEWEILDKDGLKTKVDMADLLNKTVLYKVGHHGSHNATLREHGLELMNNPELVAMIPVDRKKAEKKEWEMPEKHLFERLQQKAKGRVIIADEQNKADLKKRCDAHNLLPAEREKFLEKVDFSKENSTHLSPLYVEYVIEG